jgi:hypothetical protein
MLLSDKKSLFINNKDIQIDGFIKQTSVLRTSQETDKILKEPNL